MTDSILERIPVVGSLGYIERVRALPGSFTATLEVEAGNRSFPQAIAVVAGAGKVGYVAPEIARAYYEVIRSSATPVSCAGRRARHSDHETSGVELLLDFRSLPVPDAPT